MDGSTPLSTGDRPTSVRHAIVSVTTAMALLLYLDRLAVGIATSYIREDLRMTQTQISWFLSAFFWSYALGQVPAGWFSDRFGARRMLTFYILAWSAFTGLLGLAYQVWMLLALRLLCGVSQAGAYPTAGGLIRVWFPVSRRGTASSIVALGGRAGGVLAPVLTAWLIVQFSHGADPLSFGRDVIVDDKAFLLSFQAKPKAARTAVVERVVSRLPSSLQQSLQGISEKNPADSSASWYDELLAAIRSELAEPDLLANVDLGRLKMSAEGSDLLTQRDAGGLSPADAARLNRLVFEAAFPKVVKQFRGAGWRPTMISYGIVGIAVAIGFLIVSRDLPADHPWCNQSERQLIAEGSSSSSTAAEPEKPPFPMLAILTDLSLWGNSLMQAFTNIGWLFIVTWLPRYLEEVHNVPLKWQAIMTAIPTAAGIVGMYAGGWWTDLATQYAGRKWGRRLPVLITRFTAALGYAICLIVGNVCAPGSDKHWLPWLYVAALCLMAFSVDMGNPAVWGYAQDVGGKFTGSILGWANMWGNLGAAVAPPIYNYILGESPSVADWNTMFAACFGMFVLSGLCSLVMDSTRPLVRTPPAAGSA